MQLVIAEKPSVARSISNVIGAYKRADGYSEGSGYIVSWCVGHLVELAQPHVYDERLKKWCIEDLPIVPEVWKYQISENTKRQFFILKKMMERSDVTEIICATDAGREGELIFRLVYEMAGCKKPFKRLWISSMEDSAIREGFANLKDGHDYDALYAAAQARSWADWLVGMNGTRLFTKLYDRKLTVGRVQTPTLAMLTERQVQISSFQKQKYWNVHLHLDGWEVTKEKFFDQEEAIALADACRQTVATVTEVKSTEKSVSTPRLYDLTTLQREANRYCGFTAQKTLDLTQSLYEKKLVTYPRTDSQFLSDDMEETAEQMVGLVKKIFFTEDAVEGKVEKEAGSENGVDSGNTAGSQKRAVPDISRILSSKKVSDHHAIIPTAELVKQDLSKLSGEEAQILMLISMRLLAATGRKQRIRETDVKVSCAGAEFTAKEKIILDNGWKDYEDFFRSKAGTRQTGQKGKKGANTANSSQSDEVWSDEENEARRHTSSPLSKGQTFDSPEPSVTEHFTSPPKAFTEDSLLSAMETAGDECFDEDTEKKGLGTPATRAETIEKLVRNNYVQRKGKQLIPTEEGMALAKILPEEVKSPKLTANWENALKQIERGELSSEEFMAGITDMVRDLVTKYGSLPKTDDNPFAGRGGEKPQCEEIGKCPRCGSSVFEGNKNFWCSNRECSFCLWKENKWLSGMRKKISKKMAASLLKNGHVHVTGLYSQRKGRNFDADIVMEDDGERVSFRLDFNNRSASGRCAKTK